MTRGAEMREPATPRRVLVVDDHADVADTLCDLIRKLGFETLAVHDGAAALSVAATFLPHIVVLDLVLPDIPGEEVCRRLRDQDPAGTIQIIALTGRTTVDERAAACFDHYLLKPSGASAIFDVLQREGDVSARRA